MGIFANILDKLGIGHGKADPKPDIRPLPPKRTDLPAGGAAGAPPARTPTASPAPTPMSEPGSRNWPPTIRRSSTGALPSSTS